MKRKNFEGQSSGPANKRSKAQHDNHQYTPSTTFKTTVNNNVINEPRKWTVSLALPGSIISNAQTLELRTYLAGQIARCLAIYQINEVIVFDEPQGGTDKGLPQKDEDSFNPCHFLARLLQYQECPQYLRKIFFPVHKDLKLAGLLNPLDSPHHMRVDEWSQYREGVVTSKKKKGMKGSYVNAGLYQEVYIEKKLNAGTRITLELQKDKKNGKSLVGTIVSPTTPTEQKGIYWGYTTRLASCLSAVFDECPYPGGYSIKIGTSEKGKSIDEFQLPAFEHLLIVFGGLKGLEESVECDDKIQHGDPEALFDFYLNSCPTQGSRTIRTEEAMLITLSSLRPQIMKNVLPATTAESYESD